MFKEDRTMTVHYLMQKDATYIQMQGDWLQELGFYQGDTDQCALRNRQTNSHDRSGAAA